MHGQACNYSSEKTAAVPCRVLLCAVCLLLASSCTHAQLEMNNFEGPDIPEVLLSTPLDAENHGGMPTLGSQKQLTVVAIDEVPVASTVDQHSLWQHEASIFRDAVNPDLAAPTTPEVAAATDVDAAAYSVLSAAAAAAPAALDGPAIGSPAMGSIIPGRYVVFFNSNVTDVSSGIQR